MNWTDIIQWAKDIASLATCAALLIRPVREWIMGTEALREGQRCLLRAEIVRIYYRHKDDRTLREYEFKNMEQSFQAYKALKGNTFVEKVHDEMKDWDIV